MTTNCYDMVRGSVARFTLLDRRGAPLIGSTSVIVTKGLSQVALNEVTDQQSTTLHRTDYDKPRVLTRGKTQTIGFSADLRLAGVDPDLLWMLTGQQRIANASGVIVGNEMRTKQPLVNFAMEVWSKLASPVDGFAYGYTLFPRIRGGRVSNFSFSNGALSFNVTGARTYRNSRWGYGPYDLRWTGSGWDTTGWDTTGWDERSLTSRCVVPGGFGFGEMAFGIDPFGGSGIDPDQRIARRPVTRDLHWRNFLVDTAPVNYCGVAGLYDSVNNWAADPASQTADVLDGQYVSTSSDITDGGGA